MARIEKRSIKSPVLDKVMLLLTGLGAVVAFTALSFYFDFSFGWAIAATVPVIGVMQVISGMIVRKKGRFIHPE